MGISKETQAKINILFKTNSEMKEKLLQCDVDAIREIGKKKKKGMNPDDIIAAYESGDPETMKYLYLQAKRLVGLQELYKELCFYISLLPRRLQFHLFSSKRRCWQLLKK